jgi:hypothetical protein
VFPMIFGEEYPRIFTQSNLCILMLLILFICVVFPMRFGEEYPHVFTHSNLCILWLHISAYGVINSLRFSCVNFCLYIPLDLRLCHCWLRPPSATVITHLCCETTLTAWAPHHSQDSES